MTGSKFRQKSKWDYPTKEHSGRARDGVDFTLDIVLLIIGIVVGGLLF